MILRNVIYADKPRPLQSTTIVPIVKNDAVSVLSALNTNTPSMTPQVEKLSMERVIEWLASQDDAIRLTVARNLDDEIKQVRAEAIIEGRAIGTSAAKTEFNAQCTNTLGIFRTMTSECEELFAQQRDELIQKCTAIVNTALSKMVGEAIIHPNASLAAVKQSVQRICGARNLTIFVNDKDLENISAYKSEIAEILGGSDLNIVADSRVTSGGCLLESSFGEIDARWETQLIALAMALRNGYNNNETDVPL